MLEALRRALRGTVVQRETDAHADGQHASKTRGHTGSNDLSEAAKYCPACGEALAPFPGAEESDLIEVQVQAHIRRIQRPRYHKTCGCPQLPGIVTAPPAARVIPKSPFGVSVWTLVLLDKYLYGRPTHRLCEQLRHHGLPLSQGTLPDGLQRLKMLFEPLMPALHERQMAEKLFHGDETRWAVCEEVAGTNGPSLVSVGDAVGLSGVLPHGPWTRGRRAQSACCQVAKGPGRGGAGV